ncbi:MAG: hypothetical protein ACRELF_28970, partial [Gemmataceae bacterium]
MAKPKKPTWPLLYPGAKKIDVAALRKEVEAPWATPASSGPTVELIVGRLPDDPSGKTFRSLADACKAIPAGATGVIELRDNGPFFALAVAVADRHVILRAAAGYRPLLIWDVPRMLEQRRKLNRRDADANSAPPIFLDVKHGNLTLQDLHIALQWPDAPSAGASVVHVEDGDLTVSGCTFSVAGKPRDGMTLARLTGTHSDASRYRFTRCYCRGAGLSVLDADAPGARLLFEDCLLVGGDAPLLRIRAGKERRTQLSVVRSTMICAKTFLELGASTKGQSDPAFEWLGWDALLCRKNPEIGGELLRLRDDISARQMSWRASNCLYAGWNT